MTHAPKKIVEMYAWICEEEDGGDGVPAIDLGVGYPVPLVGSDRARMEFLRPWALAVCEGMGLPVKLVRFHGTEVIEKHEPMVRSSRA